MTCSVVGAVTVVGLGEQHRFGAVGEHRVGPVHGEQLVRALRRGLLVEPSDPAPISRAVIRCLRALEVNAVSVVLTAFGAAAGRGASLGARPRPSTDVVTSCGHLNSCQRVSIIWRSTNLMAATSPGGSRVEWRRRSRSRLTDLS